MERVSFILNQGVHKIAKERYVNDAANEATTTYNQK